MSNQVIIAANTKTRPHTVGRYAASVKSRKSVKSTSNNNMLEPLIPSPPHKQMLRGYIANLYDIMSKHGGCFYSGTFVIDDINGGLKEILKNSKDKDLGKVLHSHTGFGPNKDTVCKSGICEVHFTDKKLEFKCPNAKPREKENIKWYIFNNTENVGSPENPRDRFVFFKIEDYTTISYKHILEAYNRYIRGKNTNDWITLQSSDTLSLPSLDTLPPEIKLELDKLPPEIKLKIFELADELENSEGTQIPMNKRREDCAKDKKYVCRCTDTSPEGCKVDDPKYLTIDDKKDHFKDGFCLDQYGDFTKDTHKRIGDEFFVPSYISSAIIDTIYRNPNELVKFIKCNIDIPSNGGSIKKKSKLNVKKIKKTRRKISKKIKYSKK